MPAKKILLVIIFLFLTASAFFAPLPYALALNHETRQCAGYWGGDEYTSYVLPPGWKAFELQYSALSISVETDIGACQVATKDQVKVYKSCCSQLGYTFVAENIGVYTVTSDNLAARKAMDDYMAQLRWEQTRPIIFSTLIIVILILSIITAALWIYQNKNKNRPSG